MGKKKIEETKKVESNGEVQEEKLEKVDNYLTPKEIEKRLKLSHGTVSKLLNTKGLPLLRVGRTIRVKEEDFAKLLETYKSHTINV